MRVYYCGAAKDPPDYQPKDSLVNTYNHILAQLVLDSSPPPGLGVGILSSIVQELCAQLQVFHASFISPLALATHHGRHDVAAMLLDSGADPLAHDHLMSTPLHVACSSGHESIAQLLLDNKVPSNPPVEDATLRERVGRLLCVSKEKAGDEKTRTLVTIFSPLHLACRQGSAGLVALLLAHGAGIDAQESPIHMYPKFGRVLLDKLYESSYSENGSQGDNDSNGHQEVVDQVDDADGNGHQEAGGQVDDAAGNGSLEAGEQVDNSDGDVNQGAGDQVDDADGNEQQVAGDQANDAASSNGQQQGAALDEQQAVAGAAEDAEDEEAEEEEAEEVAAEEEEADEEEAAEEDNNSDQFSDPAEHDLLSVEPEDWRWAPLHLAAACDQSTIVKLLLCHGATVDIKDNQQRTPLHIACTRPNGAAVARALLDNGASVAALDRQLMTPLHRACQHGSLPVVRLLFEAGAKVKGAVDIDERWQLLAKLCYEYVNGYGHTFHINTWSPLHHACGNGSRALAQQLIDWGADVNAQDAKLNDKDKLFPIFESLVDDWDDSWADEYGLRLDEIADAHRGCTPLHVAAENGNADVAKLLIEHGAAVNGQDNKRRTPLHAACEHGHVAVAQLLLDQGATFELNKNMRRRCNWVETPLHSAAKVVDNHVAGLHIAKMLLSRGASVHGTVRRGIRQSTPLHYACKQANLPLVQFLLDRGARIHAVNEGWGTPLHCAAESQRESAADVVAELLSRGARLHARAASRKTALHIATEFGTVKVMRVLLEKGALVNAQRSSGRTALHDACYDENAQKVTVLLEHGAKVGIKDRWQMTALLIAEDYGSEPIRAILMQYATK